MKEEIQRVCIFAPVPPPLHGSNVATRILLESDFSKEYVVKHINASYGDSLAGLGKPSVAKLWLFLKYLLRFLRLDREASFDFVIFVPASSLWPFVRDALAIAFVSYMSRAKQILWIHTSDFSRLHHSHNALLRVCFNSVIKRTNCIVAVGNAVAFGLRGVVPDDRIAVIHNGIPSLSSYHEKTHSIKGVVVVYLSHMFEAKGWLILLKAAQRICQLHENVRFLFYGGPTDDSPLARINREFEEHALLGRIYYGGPVSGAEKVRILENADVMCLPTYYRNEAFPISILEGMQFGLAIITTDAGSIPEAIVHGRGGVIVPKCDLDALTTSLSDLVCDTASIRRMGEFNSARYHKLFSVETFSDKWIQVIDHLQCEVT
jgi:glycosyltransferase involved in cell wall biosynthesis